MKQKLGNGQITKWFENASDEEIILITMMSPGALERLCMLCSIEYQMLKEKN